MTAAAAEPRATAEPLLKIRELDKHFGPVQALYQVDLDIPAGQVTALCGDNGAGKSVLTKCISGVYQPDHGEVFWEGQQVHIRSTRDAARLGMETVYQDLALCDNQARMVLGLLKGLRDRGLAVMVISHNRNDVFEVADRIAVLYLGRMVTQDKASAFDRQRVVEYMTTGGKGIKAAS